MGREPCCCCSNIGLFKRRWTAEEDALLSEYVQANGKGNWRLVPERTGLQRCGRSCRFRWMNHLRPGIKRGNIEPYEEDIIIRLHAQLGNRWSLIARHLPGRNDNEIKNYWNNHLRKKLKRQETDHNADKLVIGSSSHGGRNEEVVQDCLDLAWPDLDSFLEDDDDVHGLDHFPHQSQIPTGKLEKIYEEHYSDFGAMRVCGGLDDKLVIGSSSHGGRNEEVVKDGFDLALRRLVSFLEDDDDVHGLDFPNQSQIPTEDGKLEKMCDELLQLITTDESKCR